MKHLLKRAIKDCLPYAKEGAVASYIPELSKADPNDFGICIISKEGKIGRAHV